MGLGRCGERVLKTPSSGRAVSPREPLTGFYIFASPAAGLLEIALCTAAVRASGVNGF